MVFASLQTILSQHGKLEGEFWESLPNDIILCIARCADSNQLPCLRLVNKQWRACCDAIISKVSISNTAVSRFGSSTIALERVTQTFPHLQTLVLWKLHPNDAFLLSRLKDLAVLDLGGTLIDDESLRSISSLIKLTTLQLWETSITDRGLKHLAKLNKLATLNLRDSNVHDEGLRYLAHLTNLTSLDLDRTQISNDGMKHLTALHKLKRLSLWSTLVGDRTIHSCLIHLTNLVRLNLGFTRISSNGVESLSTLPNLTSLEFWGIKKTEEQQQQNHIEEQIEEGE